MTCSPILAYHGSLRRFEVFEAQPPRRMSASPTTSFGVFCVADPRIAAHFTLRPHVVSEGYQSPEGSRILRDNPWWIDPDPFEPGASVASVAVSLRRPKVFSAVDWSVLVETLQQSPLVAQAMHEAWQKQGYDGLRIDAWDQNPGLRGKLPSVETDATTWVAFDPAAIRVRNWFDAISAWS